MKISKTVKDFFVVSVGNILALFSNILIGFALPIILNVENYGYYKIYTLYISYTGLLHLGFVDGVLLMFAGKDYNKLDQEKFRLYTRFFIIFELCISGIGILWTSLFLRGHIRTIILLVFLNLIWSNITLYFQYVSQATSRFGELATRKTINAILSTVVVVVLALIWKLDPSSRILSCDSYIVLSQLVSICLIGWYVFTYRDIVIGKRAKFSDEKDVLIEIFKKGFVLTVAYEVSRLVLVMDRQFVSTLFDIETYAKYAFAYNILSCVTALITGISTVMLPKLKVMSIEEAMNFFPKGMALVGCIVCFAQLGYYPIGNIITWMLPQYTQSLVYFRIIFPVLALTSCITIIVFTFYKIIDKCNIFFGICVIALAVSFFTNLVAYLFWKTPEAISWASFVSTIFWYLVSVFYLWKIYKVKWVKNFVYAILMIGTFYITTAVISNEMISITLYLVAFVLLTMLFYRNDEWKKLRGRNLK